MSTLTLSRPVRTDSVNEPALERRRDVRARRLRPIVVMTALGFAFVAAVLRLFHIETSYNLFIDETTYAAIARDTTLVTGPILHGMPFVLHPPLALLLLAVPAHVLGTQDIATLVAGLRPFVAVVGALTVAVLYLTLHRAGLRRAALVAAALVALDPLIVSFDSRVMLEAFAQLFAVLTIAAAIHAATAGPRARWRWSTLTALAGAATFGTKETFGLVVLATLVVVALTAPRGYRRPSLLAVAGTLVGYGLVNLAMINWSGFGPWWQMRTDGLSRLLGAHQPTGFKAQGASSFWEGILANGTELGGTYAILAIGGVCALSLIWGALRRRSSVGDLPPAALAATRVVAIWAVCACGYLAYAVAFGSLEEQMFYIAAAPCAATIAIRVFLIGQRVLRRAAVAGAAAIMLVQGAAWVQVHTTPDDVYAQMLAQVSDVTPAGSTMDVTEGTAQFVLSGYHLGQWVTVAQLRANHVQYVLLSDRLIEGGYGLVDREFADAVQEHGSLILSVNGRDSDLELYDVRDWTDAAQSHVTTKDGGS
jgi:4-amino-4-deoxy-L-arabinose transferase-like glycosyltransferase